MPRPYIGITGFMNAQEVDTVLRAVPKDFARLVMIGVLMSNKTLYGVKNKYPNRYPGLETLWNIFSNDERALNLIHFSTDHPDTLYSDLCRAQELAGPNCHGFQLNMRWPDPAVVERYRLKVPFRKKTIVLQCGAGALSAKQLVDRLDQYYGLIDYVLLDESGGTGKEFDGEKLVDLVHCIKSTLPNVGVGVAGGLCASSVDRLSPLQGWVNISVDAEGKLRDENDNLMLREAVKYLFAAAEVLL